MKLNLDFKIFNPFTSSLPIDEKIWNQFLSNIENDDAAFIKLPDQKYLDELKKIKEKFKDKKYLIHIGIGGSSLGTQTIINALAPDAPIFFLENISENSSRLLDKLNTKDCLFNIVSKSGNTLEVTTHLELIIQKLKENNISENEFSNFFILTSSFGNGPLNQFQKKHNLHEFFIPEKLGGRFSVLSAVGLFPALFAGLNIESLIRGAENINKSIKNFPNDIFKKLAHFHTSLYLEHNIKLNVMMPYEERLSCFALWFSQLWGESLGKKKDHKHIGITPLASLGPRDQHSLLQLYLDGPKDKLLTFLTIKEKKMPKILEKTLDALQAGTALALEEEKRPYYTIELEKLNEESLGELIQLYHYLVVFIATSLDINPYNQPAVEIAKKHTKAILGK